MGKFEKKKQLIDGNETLNQEILSYVKENKPKNFKKDLIQLCATIIGNINLKKPDPQNIFLIPFMKQNGLDCEL